MFWSLFQWIKTSCLSFASAVKYLWTAIGAWHLHWHAKFQVFLLTHSIEGRHEWKKVAEHVQNISTSLSSDAFLTSLFLLFVLLLRRFTLVKRFCKSKHGYQHYGRHQNILKHPKMPLWIYQAISIDIVQIIFFTKNITEHNVENVPLTVNFRNVGFFFSFKFVSSGFL